MGGYFLVAILLQAAVDSLILIVSARLSKQRTSWYQVVLAVAAASVWSALAALENRFFKTELWFLLGMMVVSAIAFGIKHGSLRPSLLYMLLRIAMSGIASEGGNGLFWVLVLWAVWVYGFWYSRQERFLSVELCCNGKTAKLRGLVDTGNQLQDPVTGRSVLVVGADVAMQLTGLTHKQLMQPVETMGAVPGLRLIPFQTVSQSGGLMLAMQLKKVRIGGWQGSTLVAFSPRVLDEQGRYQALIGGML